MRNLYLVIILSCFITYGCNTTNSKKQSASEIKSELPTTNKKDIPKKDILQNLEFEKAIEKYGEPVTSTTFNTKDEPLNEFRIELSNYFTSKELEKGILFKEATWDIDSNTSITVWYNKSETGYTPVHLQEWNMASE